MTRAEVIDIVLLKMDEVSPSAGMALSLSEMDESKTVELIEGVLDECARELLLEHPIHLLPATSASPGLTKNLDGSGYLVLPDDFLRLVSFGIQHWENPITELITEQDPRYRLQKNKYTRGGIARPVGVRRQKHITDSVKEILEYYSLPTTHTLDHFLYIPETVAEGMADDLIKDGLSWLAASKTFAINEDTAPAKQAFAFYEKFKQRN